MLELIATAVNSINIFGMGIAPILVMTSLMIANSLTRKDDSTQRRSIIYAAIAMLMIYIAGTVAGSILLLITAVIAVIIAIIPIYRKESELLWPKKQTLIN